MKGGVERIGQALRYAGCGYEPIDHDQQFVRDGQIDSEGVGLLGSGFIQIDRALAHEYAHKPECFQVFDHAFVRQARAAGQRKSDQQARAFGQSEHCVSCRLHGIGPDAAAAHRALRAAGPRPEQPQIVVDLRGGTDSRATCLGGILLLDRDGRADAFDGVDERLLHALEELFGVRRKRLHVACAGLRRKACRKPAMTCPSRSGR